MPLSTASADGVGPAVGLSIVNLNRQTLPGPQLLHDLIATGPKEEIILDFLRSDGTRHQQTYEGFHRITELLAQDIRARLPTIPLGRCIIPVIIPQCPELYIAWVAVLKAGAGFCPISHDVPPERLKFIVKDVEASFVLTTSKTLGHAQNILSDVQCMPVSFQELKARLDSQLESHLSSKVLPCADPSGPAYVMYTSGSTGLPKGVMVSHQSVSQSLLAHDDHIPPFKRFLQFASPTFDVSIFEVFFPFFRGATLVGCDRERMLSDLPATIRLLNADAAELTPTVAGTLLKSRDAAPCLKTLLTIGEMLSPQVIREFGGDSTRRSMLYAMYGPTEAAIHCTLSIRLASSASVRSIGRPLRTVTAIVLKESSLEIASLGESGELAIAGQLADGYLNRPDQNDDVFVELPGHGPIYRTGDRAICLPNGELEILGRMSSGQVKIRGQRVELGEVEEVASKVHGVQLAVASIIDEVLVLFCSASRNVQAVDISAICKSWLPPYMRPGEVVLVQGDIPRLPSGKVDRKTLEHNFRESKPSPQQEEFTFQDQDERDIGQALENELGRKIGRSTSFWSVGLDSLRTIKVASRLRARYKGINAGIMAEVNNVAELSALIKSASSSFTSGKIEQTYGSSDEWQAIKKNFLTEPSTARIQSPWETLLPCSTMQIAMLVETMADGARNFNDIWLQLGPDVSYEDLRQAFGKVAKENDILRSGYLPTDQRQMPFVRVVWEDLIDTGLSLQHPLQITQPTSPDGGQVLVRIHHAVYDGWSWELILNDLNTILAGERLLRRTQFSEFQSYERSQAGVPSNETVNYWCDLFQDFAHSPFPNLSPSQLDKESKASIVLPLSISYRQLSETATSLRCSRETIFEAAWALLLASYVDSHDIAIGVVSASRHIPLLGIESIIGPCLSTFPLRVDIDTVMTVSDLLNHIQRQRARHLKYGNITLRDIKSAAGLSPESRLFDTLCVWQESDEGNNSHRSKVSTTMTHDALDYALVLEFEPREETVSLKITFNADLLPEAHARLLASQLDDLTNQMIHNLELKLDACWETSSQTILSSANSAYERFTGSFNLLTSITDLAKTHPERPAVEFVHNYNADTGLVDTETLTYGDLLKKASSVASALRSSYRVQPDHVVCLMAPRSISLYIGILGVIMAGAAYICVEPATPRERVQQILCISNSHLVLTDTTPASVITDDKQASLSISDILKQPLTCEAQIFPDATVDHLAYAVFTSGSTGVPKGVLITRRNLLSNLEQLSQLYPGEPSTDRVLQACSPAFDVSVFEIFWTWHMGMTLCTATNDILFRDIEGFIRTLNITHLSMTPSVAALVHPDNVPRVKMLVTAGEPMNSKVFTDWANRGLYQGYGPSETTNICNVRPNVSNLDVSNNVGPVLSNTSIFVCRRPASAPTDATVKSTKEAPFKFQAVPKGGVGEIWIGGEQVGRGYADPALTARSFFNHPQYGRLYRSGDIGRLLADDSLMVIGREDDQVKLRGQRIELGEINSSLLRSREVQDAVSMIVTSDGGSARLVSFWTAWEPPGKTSGSTTTKSLFDQLTSVLPNYMIPDVLLRLEKMPLTKQGKVDRKAMINIYLGLRPEELQTMSRESEISQNADDLSGLEGLIAQAISDVLGVPFDTINRTSSFYALGLDSISAIRLGQALRTHLPTVEISTLLLHPSIGQLMAFLHSHKEEKPVHNGPDDLSRRFDHESKARIIETYSHEGLEVDKFLPCTPLQEVMAIGSLASSSRAYHNTLLFKIHGDLSKLREVWTHAMSRHQLLRTGFASLDSAETPFTQVVLKNFELPWWSKDSRKAAKQALEPLMLPPWSLTVQQPARQEYELTLDIHHCLYDATAMSILLHEVQSLYHGRELQPSVSFDRYLSFMDSSKSDTTDRFWRHKLRGASICKLGDFVMADDKIQAGNRSTAASDATLSFSELQKFAKKIASTPLALFQTAWSRLLFRIFRRQDVCFGNVVSGRSLPIDGVDLIVAPCFNTVPIRVRLQRGESNSDLCRNLQQMNVEMLPYQPSSLRRIQRQNVSHGGALFDTLLLLQQDELKLDHHIWTLLQDTGDMSFPFILEIDMSAETDVISFKLHSEVTNADVLSRLIESFDNLVSHTAQFPQSRASDTSIIAGILPKMKPGEEVSPAQASEVIHLNGYHDVPEHLSKHEVVVRDIMRQLKTDLTVGISRNTTIFHLGFDSINAIQIAARLRKRGYNISSADILEAATVRQIANLCQSREPKPEAPVMFDLDEFGKKNYQAICSSNNIVEAKVQSVYPCTPTQSGILSQFLLSGRRVYYNTMQFDLEQDIDLVELKKAWNIAQGMHAMLRTGFVATDDPETPFAMVTYHADAVELPWAGDVSSSPRSRFVGSSLDTADLGDPPWQLRVSTKETPATLEISMLHALYDAQSLDIILRDVASIYRDAQPPKPIELASGLSKILSMSKDESCKTFWRELLHGHCLTRFPDMRIYNDNSSVKFGVASQRCTLSRAALERTCATVGASLQAVCASAWSAILSAYTAQDSITFGIVLSGRDFDQEEENEVAFPCLNTVPFAIKATQNPRELLQQASRQCIGLMRHQHTPLSSIKRWTSIEDDLFDTIMVLQKLTSNSGPKRPWTLTKDDATAEYAVSLEIILREDDIVDFQLVFRENLLPHKQAALLLRQFDASVRRILNSTDDDAFEIPASLKAITPAVDERIHTTIRYLHQFVELTTEQKPDEIAVEFVTSLHDGVATKDTWTYSQLDSRGNQIAHLLQRQNAQVGSLVAVCFEKCPEASFAILGVQKAGYGFLAIDPGAPKARKEFILRDSGCKIVLTTKDKISEFPSSEDVAVLQIVEAELEKLPPGKPRLSRELMPQDTCYCLYTSGTTGVPKGCLISHDSAVQAMLSFQRIFRGRWNESSRWLQFASLHFDVSVLEQYWSWGVGIRVTSAPRDLLFEDLPGTINALKITHLDLTPSLARLLSPEDVPSLCQGVFIVGGEQVRQDILETWGDSQCLYNFYGPSEVTIGCTVHRQVPRNAKATNIGQQWDNVGSFVLEPDSQEPVLRGAIGELCLSGPLVGKGYLNRPDLTAQKFVTLTDFNTRVYRTGDLVRLLHDNSFEFMGRIDDQVKLRGQRLEIGEIDHVAIGAASSIRDTTTMVLEHPAQRKEQLVTFFSTAQRRATNEEPVIILSDEMRDLAGEIHKATSERLPAYMVPTYMLAVSSLPLSVNNKVDHKALKALYEQHALDSGQTSPRGAELNSEDAKSKDHVAELLAAFLQIPKSTVKANSRLFELGLDSISAIGLSRAFKKHGFRNSEVGIILRHPIVSDLARVLDRQPVYDQNLAVLAARKRIDSFGEAHYNAISEALNVSKESIECIAPCTHLQEGMISKVMRSGPEDITYFSCMRFELESHIDLGRLREAWHSAQESTSILRTYFVSTVDGFAQAVLRTDPSGVKSQIVETGDDDDARLDSSFRQWVSSVRSFSNSKPWKVDLRELGQRRFMVIQMFHGLYDGASLPLLLDRVTKLYDHPRVDLNLAKEFYEVLPYGPLCVVPDERYFWSSRLSSIEPHQIARTHSDNDVETEPIHIHEQLNAPKFQAASTALNVTTSAIFQASLLYVLQKMFNVNPTIGVVISGRALANGSFEDVIGPLFNTIPFAVNHLANGSTLDDLARACHEFNVDAIPYQHTALRKIAQYLNHDISSGLFDTLFVFQKPHPEVEKCELWREVSFESSPEYPLNIEVEQRGDHFMVSLVAKAQYLDEEMARRLLRDYLDTIQSVGERVMLLPDDFCASGSNGKPESSAGIYSQSRSLPVADAEDIEWTETDLAIRRQLARLSSVKEDIIQLDRPNIFELGLDSIEAMKLAARLKKIGFKIAISAIMRSPTVAGIANEIRLGAQSHPNTTRDRDVPMPISELQARYRRTLQDQGIDLENVEAILPVTPMQEGLLAEAHKYFNVMTFRLKAETDIKRLAKVWQSIIRTQPILRTRFEAIETSEYNAAFVQYVSKDEMVMQTVSDQSLASVVQSLKEDTEQQALSSQYARIRIIINQPSSSFLVLGMPHALYDAWSLHLLHQKVIQVYHSLVTEEHDMGAIRYQQHLEESIGLAQNHKAQAFWRSQLSNLWPSLFRRYFSGNTQSTPPRLLQKESQVKLPDVLRFCKEQGITTQSLGLACLTMVLAHYSRQLDVCFGLVLSGRTTEGSERLIFPTFNTVLFRPMIDEGWTKAQAVKEVHKTAVRVSEHQHFPLREAMKYAREQGVGPDVFDTLFTFQKLPTSDSTLPDLYDEVTGDEIITSPPYAVNIELEGHDQALSWTVAFQAGVADHSVGIGLLQTLDDVLLAFMSTPGEPLSQQIDDGLSLCGLPGVTLTANDHLEKKNPQEAVLTETWNQTETIIRQVLVKVSQSDEELIGKTTGFFHLGLDSVSAIKVSSLLRGEGLRLPVSEIVKAQTIEKMAVVAALLASDAQPADLVNGLNEAESISQVQKNELAIPEVAVEAVIPCTAGQVYMLDMWTASDGQLFYPTFWLKVCGVDSETLRSAIHKLRNRTPILRTTFASYNENGLSKTLQVVLKSNHAHEYQLPWSFHIQESRDGLLVTLRMHHALYDAVSFQLMVLEIEKICTQVDIRSPPNTRMGEYVSRLRSHERSAEEFWRRYLGSNPGSYATVDKGSFGAKRHEKFDPTVLHVHQMTERLKHYGISMQALFFSAYAQVYSTLLCDPGQEGQEPRRESEVVVGIYLANRSLDIGGLTELIAPTFNIVPLRIQVGSKTLFEMAQQVQHDLGEVTAVGNCGASMRDIHAWTSVKVDTFVNFLSLPGEDESAEGQAGEGKVTVTHAKLDAGEKNDLEAVESPCPFLAGGEATRTSSWCLVSGSLLVVPGANMDMHSLRSMSKPRWWTGISRSGCLALKT